MSDRVIPLYDGAFEMEMRLFVGIMADPDAAARLMGLDRLPERVEVPVWAFAIEMPEGLVLVDTGGGAMMGQGFGGVARALDRAGLRADRIKRVFLTHLHGDHCGGLLDADGRPALPGARIALSRTEASFWTGPDLPADLAPIAADARRVLEAYRGKIDLVEPGARLDGGEAIDAAGHTPGHLGWAFNAASAIAAGDIVHIGPAQIARPDWGSDWDMDAAAATAARRRLIDLAQGRGAELLCAHGGRIAPNG